MRRILRKIAEGETANLGVQAALTGHLVFSTLHTNNAATCLPRLLDMEIEPFLIASTVKAVVGQRLVRRLCSFCRQQRTPEAEEKRIILDLITSTDTEAISYIHALEAQAAKENIGGDAPLSTSQEEITQLWHADPNGCDECNHTGFKGRIGIYEIMMMGYQLKTLIQRTYDSFQIKQEAIKLGMVTLRRDGIEKVLRGVTSIEEVIRVTQK